MGTSSNLYTNFRRMNPFLILSPHRRLQGMFLLISYLVETWAISTVWLTDASYNK